MYRVTELKMEGAKQARPPAVVPLTTDLIKKILQQQQQQKGAALSAANKAAQGVTASQYGSVPQQQGATAINLAEMGKHHHQVQGSRAAISVQVLNNNVNPPDQTASQPPKYTYKVKIVNPGKKSVVIVRYLHSYTGKFESVNGLRVRLMDEFQQHVPATATFDVGYFEGKQQSKIWLVTSDDLDRLYQLHPKGGEVLLWCEGMSETGNGECRSAGKRSKEADSAVSKRTQQEAEVECAFKELRERHGETWDMPRLKLWARCIASGIHDDYDNPPDSPAFSGAAPKRARKESLSEAISGAAVAIVKALSTDPKEKASERPQSVCPPGPGVSPGRAVDLRMKNFQQLRFLQQLYEDNILDEKQYAEQKESILASLCNLN